MTNNLNNDNQIAIFRGKTVRKTIYKKEWWFSILDVIKILTDSPQPKTYWAKMKDRDKEISQPFPFWEHLRLPAEDGKMRETDCADTEGIFRIIQSIPSPKAEPFKRWLAKVGYERVQEIKFLLLPLPMGGWEGWLDRQRTKIDLPNPSLLKRGLEIQGGVV